jgi:hypothetical protein
VADDPRAAALGRQIFYDPHFSINCTNPTPAGEQINYATSDQTATAPDDYVATSGELDVPAGSSGQGIVVDVVDDTDAEEEETFLVTLSNPDGVVTFDRQATGTIQDNDDGPGPCVLLSETAVSVSGPASTLTQRGMAGPLPRITMTNCGGSTAAFDVRGTNATGAGATWELTNASSGGPVDSLCELGTDLFRADLTVWLSDGGGIGTILTETATTLLDRDSSTSPTEKPLTLDPAAEREISPQVELPCEGSSGLDQPMTMDVVLTAIAAP